MRNRTLFSLMLWTACAVFVSGPAFAQTATAASLGRSVSLGGIPSETGRVDATFLADQTPAARRPAAASTTGAWRPLAFAGFVSHAGSGFMVGGGAVKSSFLNNDKYALQLDAAYNNFGSYGRGCDISGLDCSAHQISFSGAFLYMFKETSSGWTPYAGGGILVIHTSLGVSDDTSGFDISDSVTDAGIQAQGGIKKNTSGGKQVGVEVRLQGAGGGGAAFLGRIVF